MNGICKDDIGLNCDWWRN